MRFAVVTDNWFPAVGGGQINAWEISRRIAKKGHKVDIITRNNGTYKLPKIKNLQIYQLGARSRPDDNVSKIIFVFNALIFLFRHNYDLIHIHPFISAFLVYPLRFFKRTPLIFTVHGTRLFEKGQNKTFSIRLEKFILTKIKFDRVISVTRAFTGFPNVNRNIVVIPNGVDITRFNKVKPKSHEGTVILWVGRFDPVKRVEDLVEAFESASLKRNDLVLRLIGYGYQETKIKEIVKNLKLKNVIFIGRKVGDELIREYKSADIFVLPSASEGQPQVLLEAMAAGLPIIATNVGGIGELIKNTSNCYLVPPRSPRDLAKAIIKALGSKIKRDNYGNILKNHDWDKIAMQTYDVYKTSIN